MPQGLRIFRYKLLAVILKPKMRDQILAHDVPQRVLQLHRLDEQIVLRINTRRRIRILEVEAQPLLNAQPLQRRRARARSMNRHRSSASGAARIESRQRKSTLICIG